MPKTPSLRGMGRERASEGLLGFFFKERVAGI
jgi:hypothetical protein